MTSAAQRTGKATKKRRSGAVIAFMVALGLRADAPTPNLMRDVAVREARTEQARGDYTYRQTMVVEELDDHGLVRGTYREARDVVFSKDGVRSEVLVGRPCTTLSSSPGGTLQAQPPPAAYCVSRSRCCADGEVKGVLVAVTPPR